jgi:tetratricopeptide (TPR) repeat protein
MFRLTTGTSVLLLIACLRSAIAAEGADARALFNRGATSYALGRYAEAAQLFEKSFELKQDPAILYNAAQAHRLAGNKQQALVLYKSYLRLYGAQGNAAEVEQRIIELRDAIEAEQRAKASPPAQSSHAESPPPATPRIDRRQTTVLVNPPLPPPSRKPLTKRGWFWGVVVGSAVVVGGAIAVGVILGTAPQGPDITLGTVKAN